VDEFTHIFVGATAEIVPEYFLVPIHGGEDRYRERVYCYELYHQMRRRWAPGSPYFLNGEADKQAHPYFVGSSRAPKPDFIVHIPGTGTNYAVVEVKSAGASDVGIQADLGKLMTFRVEIGYQRALYLFYGLRPEEASAKLQRAGATDDQLALVELWVHPYPGSAAQNVRAIGGN
jgi:hypothetical protein